MAVRTRAPRAKRQQRAALLGAPLPTARQVDVRYEKTCRASQRNHLMHVPRRERTEVQGPCTNVRTVLERLC